MRVLILSSLIYCVLHSIVDFSSLAIILVDSHLFLCLGDDARRSSQVHTYLGTSTSHTACTVKETSTTHQWSERPNDWRWLHVFALLVWPCHPPWRDLEDVMIWIGTCLAQTAPRGKATWLRRFCSKSSPTPIWEDDQDRLGWRRSRTQAIA